MEQYGASQHHGTAAAGLAGTNFLRLVEFYENIHLKLISEALLLLGSTNIWVAIYQLDPIHVSIRKSSIGYK